MKIRSPRDFWAGVVFVVVGLAFAAGARAYAFGSSARPGPGYFPLGLGVLLALLGLATIAGALGRRADPAEAIGAWAGRPVVLGVAGVVLFAFVLPRLGLAVALPLLVLVSALAGEAVRPREVAINAAVLTLACWLVFVKGLGLAIPLWPAWLAP